MIRTAGIALKVKEEGGILVVMEMFFSLAGTIGFNHNIVSVCQAS